MNKLMLFMMSALCSIYTTLALAVDTPADTLVEAAMDKPVYQYPDLQRLFTTSAERVAINEQRLGSELSEEEKKALRLDANRRLHFEALLRTEAGYSLWLNGRLIERAIIIGGIQVDPKKIFGNQLHIQTEHGVRRIALGQVYWITQDKVLEAYEKP